MKDWSSLNQSHLVLLLASTANLMGIRESRRIKCDYTFTLEDWLARKEFEGQYRT